MALTNQELEKIIREKKLLPENKLAEVAQLAESFNQPLQTLLIEKGLLTDKKIGEIIAGNLGVPFVCLKNKIIPAEILTLIPEKIAVAYQFIPFDKKDNRLFVALTDPKNFELLNFLGKKTDLQIIPHFIMEDDLRSALAQYKSNIKADFAKIIAETVEKAGQQPTGDKNLEQLANQLPIIRVMDTLMEYAIAEKASDLHIEGLEKDLLIRFRIDGVLQDIITLPKLILPAVIARIKVLCNLKIDEHRLPQDGRFKYRGTTTAVALRVSIIPGFYGENVVMRLLLESERPLTLEELGIIDYNNKILQDNIKKAHGMVLITGPTGSGKTTTLYSILAILNTPKVKICTIEDPIEYGIARINQMQVNATVSGLTFASGLRSLLRHDPDIIMIGEIRDKETADIAVHSALTGHLVLSTLHTNDAASTIPRLIDLGVEPFLVVSTVNMVGAQRLVRRICQGCREETKIPSSLLEELIKLTSLPPETIKKITFYHGRGCPECRQTGYKGRVGIYEMMDMHSDMTSLIIQRAPAEEYRKAAIKKGMVTMLDDGLMKIQKGLTTAEELLRVAKE